MTHHRQQQQERNDAVIDHADHIRETAAAAQRDRLLAELKQTKNYTQAIKHATDHPDALWSFPLLENALVMARNAELGIKTETGDFEVSNYGPDLAAVFPAIRHVMNQPYAKNILDYLVQWAPRELLAHADSFSARPFAPEIIAKAMSNALTYATDDAIGDIRDAGRLPIESLDALHSLPQESLRTALKNSYFATQILHYHDLHERCFSPRNNPAPEELKKKFDTLHEPFQQAQVTLAASPAPAPNGAPILVLSSPSGGGKSTQRRFLMADNPHREFLVSYTTRPPRPDEVDGVDYHFLSIGRTQTEAKAEFERLMKDGEILFESTSFNGNRYGTPRQQLEKGLATNKQLIADVNLDGVKALRAAYPHQVQALFLDTPLDELRRRLRKRDITPYQLTDEQRASILATIDKRMRMASGILAEAKETINGKPAYDAIVPSASTPEATFANVKQALSETAPQTTINTGKLQGALQYISTKRQANR